MRLTLILIFVSSSLYSMELDSVPSVSSASSVGLGRQYQEEDSPHSSRYFFGPTGYNLAQGEGYYQNTWLLINQVSYGFSDNFSMGVGVVPLFLFGVSASPVWVTPKLSIPMEGERGALGVGGLMGTVFGQQNTGFGILYGIGTVGSRDANATLGLGYGYAGGSWGRRPAISLSGLYRTSDRWAIQTENYYLQSGDEVVFIMSIGGRWMGPSIAIDFGLVRPAFGGDSGNYIGLPWLSITAPFGMTK